MKRLTGSRTLPQNFYTQVMSSFENHPIKVGMYVEVVDKNCVSAMRVATVEEIVGCRIRLKYHEPKVGEIKTSSIIMLVKIIFLFFY